MDENIAEYLLDVSELAVETLDLDEIEDIEIILRLLECCEDLPKKRRKREWVKHFPVMNEILSETATFLNQIGMQREIFNYILSKIENDIKKQDTIMRKSITPAERLAVTLRYLATGESFKSTNIQTNISDSFLCAAIPEVCEAICKHFADEYLKLPSTKHEWELIENNFTNKWQFPNCLGALDVKHIDFQPLRKDSSLFNNFKGTCSIVMLALVDADCRFIYVDVGCSGGTRIADVLLQSGLQKIINNAEENFPADKVIGNERRLPHVLIGGDDFPLQRHLMKRYTHKTKRKERHMFNYRLVRAKHVVDRAFLILSSRFLILQKKFNISAKKVELIIKTCCVLHNLLSFKSEDYLNKPLQSDTSISTAFSTEDKTIPNSEAQSIRQGFQDYFNNEGKLN